MSSTPDLPCLNVNLALIRHNARVMSQLCRHAGIQPAGVTKLMRGAPQVAKAMLEGGIEVLADSRLPNLKRLSGLGAPRLLLRIPQLSQASEVVTHCEISLNSEESVIRALSDAAVAQRRAHRVIVMQDLGDLREGCFDENETVRLARLVHALPGLTLEGIGANLACYGGVAPSEDNLGRLVKIADRIKSELDVEFKTVSGCNSAATFMLLEDRIPKGITQLRLGASLLLGIGLNDEPIPGLRQDTMHLEVEVIELKEKPSVPICSTALDAFGNKPVFEDFGIRLRALCALGKQDVDFNHLTAMDPGIRIIGGSSDHLILDVTDAHAHCRVGDTIRFTLSYGGVLACMTSDYVSHRYLA
jgi:predicted amino acid racemase